MRTFVLSLGGSIVAPPEGPDAAYLADLRKRMESWLERNNGSRIVLVVGGGGPARSYQGACREIGRRLGASFSVSQDSLDWLGIAATRLNAQLVKTVFGDLCPDDVVTDPSAELSFTGRVLVASGWKPGFSTDFDAVMLAERFGAKTILNLSNIAKVCTADPRTNPGATPIDSISWADFRRMVGSAWIPGANLPFDPIASARAEKSALKVICAAGRDLDNLFRILDGESFVGTAILPE